MSGVFLLSLQHMSEGRTCVKRWFGRQCVGILHMNAEEDASGETLREFLEVFRATGEIPD